MTLIVSSINAFLNSRKAASLADVSLTKAVNTLLASEEFRVFLLALVEAPAFSPQLSREFAAAGAVAGISACRMLRGSLNLSLGRFFTLLGQLFASFSSSHQTLVKESDWRLFADRVQTSAVLSGGRLVDYLTRSLDDREARDFYSQLAIRLEAENPHAIYPTSSYRESDGYVESTPDNQTIEAVMSVATFSTLKIVDHALDVNQPALKDIYKSLGRCVCLVDGNVEVLYGRQIRQYFQHHDIGLDMRIYRAMEVDKAIPTVERMLGEFKALGVSRNEPVLLIGGGVLADTGGLACALYGRNTPYVMLATSIVTAIDAGPSPRTCCDGFGYKNLVGAYHPPVVCITDRFFFNSLREGWLRHGIAEIIKMGVVKNEELFCNLEAAQSRLIDTRFGTINCEAGDDIHRLSQQILGGALKSYVASEYDNLYETHQCRPHAYGHTWSPGFEIKAGLLHGHAVSTCMGLGAYLSYRLDWIGKDDFHRILTLMSNYGLSLWHDILDSKDVVWRAQQTVVQKRGNNLVAPLPKGGIGQCGYLNALSQSDLYSAIDQYRSVCQAYPRKGRGIDPHCRDVDLEDPSTVMASTLAV